MPSPERIYTGSVRALSVRLRRSRRGADRRHPRRGRRAGLARHADGARVRRRSAPGASGSARGWAREPSRGRRTAAGAAAAPRPRGSLALRRRLLGGRLLDLLLARGRRRPRPRADAADLPRRRPAVRPDDAHLRRGRGDVPRARRLVDVRPLRLQRAGLVHRRLGDPDRLPDRHRPGGDLRPALPRRRSPGASTTPGPEIAVATAVIVAVCAAQHPRPHRAPAPAGAWRCWPSPTCCSSWR